MGKTTKHTAGQPTFDIGEDFAVYPEKIFTGSKSLKEAYKKLDEKCVYLSSNTTVNRKLDEMEIDDIRQNYTSMVENERIEAKSNLMSALTQAEIMKKKIKSDIEEAESILDGVETQINDHVRMIKRGTTEMQLDAEKSFRIALDNKYLYYTWTGDAFSLAKVENMPFIQQGELFSSQSKNQETFTELFGIQFGDSRFEEISITDANFTEFIGRRLAAPATNAWIEDFTDEDTGEVVSIERKTVANIEADKFLTSEDLQDILDEGISTIVVYKTSATQAEEAGEVQPESESGDSDE